MIVHLSDGPSIQLNYHLIVSIYNFAQLHAPQQTANRLHIYTYFLGILWLIHTTRERKRDRENGYGTH